MKFTTLVLALAACFSFCFGQASDIYAEHDYNSLLVLEDIPFDQIDLTKVMPVEILRLVIANAWREGMTFTEFKDAAEAAYDAFDNAEAKAERSFETSFLQELYNNFYLKPKKCWYPSDVLPFAKARIATEDEVTSAMIARYLPNFVKHASVNSEYGWTSADYIYVFKEWAKVDKKFSTKANVVIFIDFLFSNKVNMIEHKADIYEILKEIELVYTLKYYELEDESAEKKELKTLIAKIMLLERVYK